MGTPTQREIKESIVMRLHERCGRCRHCGKKNCPGKANYSYLPLKVSADDVLWAIGLDSDIPAV